ncbi:MAG: hypothetical protein KAH91_01820 [Thermoplasmatales archaeon]|nr:hypothetical protein [Thermoplasmatales archaeon]
MMKKEIISAILFSIVTSLALAGCTSNTDSSSSDNNQVTLEMNTIMFDFSTGEIVTEEGTSEDIDISTGAKEGFVGLTARNGAEIMISGDAEYTMYIDVYEGATCELLDREGGKATFIVNEISTNTTGLPTVTITWTYFY